MTKILEKLRSNPLHLIITKKDIANGIRHSKVSCPFANGLKRKLDVKSVQVHNRFIKIIDKDGEVTKLQVEQDLQKVISEFDKTGKMKPRRIFIGKTDGKEEKYVPLKEAATRN